MAPIGRMLLKPQSRQLLRRDRGQVAFCPCERSFPSRLHERSAACRPHSLVRRHAAHAAGGPNFHEIPINAPVAQAHNNQRDGFHRQEINRGRVAYEPNSLAGGCPFQAGARGFMSFPEPWKRARSAASRTLCSALQPATLFFNSQTDVEKMHHHSCFRFELTRCSRRRFASGSWRSYATFLTDSGRRRGRSGHDWYCPSRCRKCSSVHPSPKSRHPARCRSSRGPHGSIKTRKIALLVAEGVDGEAITTLAPGAHRAGCDTALRRHQDGHGVERNWAIRSKWRSRWRPRLR